MEINVLDAGKGTRGFFGLIQVDTTFVFDKSILFKADKVDGNSGGVYFFVTGHYGSAFVKIDAQRIVQDPVVKSYLISKIKCGDDLVPSLVTIRPDAEFSG